MLATSDLYKTAIASGTRASHATVYFGLYDVTAKDEAQPVASDSQPFTDIQTIKDNIRVPAVNVATLEEDYFKLDGSFLTTPDDLSTAYLLGWWSHIQSGIDRAFTTNPTIQVTFQNLHSSLGAEVFFDSLGGSYCEAFKLTWTRDGETVAETLVEGNSATRKYVDTPVENYNGITLELIRTDKPFRYARVEELNYGGEEVFDDNELISASVVEEVDPSNGTLSVNTLKVKVLNTDQRFNMINPSGVYALLQKRQQLVAETGIELPNGSVEMVQLGAFYLSNWENATGLTAELEATDVFGLLDRTKYYSSPFWVNASLDTVLSHILSDAGQFPYSISAELSSVVINGYIPVMSHREAIQMVLVAARASVRDNRLGVLEFYRPNYSVVDKDINYSTVINTPKIAQKPLISSVSVTAFGFTLASEASQLYQETLDLNGTQAVVIPYGKAASEVSIVVSGQGSLSGSPTYSAVAVKATIVGSGTLTITVNGKEYVENKKVITVSLGTLLAGDIPQDANVSENTLISGSGVAQSVAQYVLDYYQHRIKQTLDYWDDPAIQAGDNVSVQTMFSVAQAGIIERKETQFSPNLKSRMEVTG